VRGKHRTRRSLAPLVLGLCVWLVWPAQSLASALVRFIHGVPGVGTVTVKLGGASVGAIGFGQSTQWHNVRTGSFHWNLVEGGKALAQGTASVASGTYDIVVLDKTSGVGLGIYKTQAGKAGTSLVRFIHAARELGSPEFTLDSQPATKSLSFTQATPYLSVNPGAHSLAALRVGDRTPLVPGTRVSLRPDVAYSAIVLGSRGQRVQVVTVVDRGAPLTRSVKASTQPQTTAGQSPSNTVLVRPGDSLWTIARGQLPAGASDHAVQLKLLALWTLNANRVGTGDPSLIFPGQRLRLS